MLHGPTDVGFRVDLGPWCCGTTAEALDLIDRYSQRRSQRHTRTAGRAQFAHAWPEPRGTCPHASATENSPLTNSEEPCTLSYHRCVDELLICLIKNCAHSRGG